MDTSKIGNGRMLSIAATSHREFARAVHTQNAFHRPAANRATFR